MKVWNDIILKSLNESYDKIFNKYNYGGVVKVKLITVTINDRNKHKVYEFEGLDYVSGNEAFDIYIRYLRNLENEIGANESIVEFYKYIYSVDGELLVSSVRGFTPKKKRPVSLCDDSIIEVSAYDAELITRISFYYLCKPEKFKDFSKSLVGGCITAHMEYKDYKDMLSDFNF